MYWRNLEQERKVVHLSSADCLFSVDTNTQILSLPFIIQKGESFVLSFAFYTKNQPVVGLSCALRVTLLKCVEPCKMFPLSFQQKIKNKDSTERLIVPNHLHCLAVSQSCGLSMQRPSMRKKKWKTPCLPARSIVCLPCCSHQTLCFMAAPWWQCWENKETLKKNSCVLSFFSPFMIRLYLDSKVSKHKWPRPPNRGKQRI